MDKVMAELVTNINEGIIAAGDVPSVMVDPKHVLELIAAIQAQAAEIEHRRGYATMTAAWERRALDAETKVTEQAARISALEESILLINRVAKDSSVSDEQVFQEAERLVRKIKGTEH